MSVPYPGYYFMLTPFKSSGAMRVIVTARSTFATGYERVLQRLVAILGVISKNPSNPNFDQYIFESISALMRSVLSHRV